MQVCYDLTIIPLFFHLEVCFTQEMEHTHVIEVEGIEEDF